jgi:hypothetical protein
VDDLCGTILDQNWITAWETMILAMLHSTDPQPEELSAYE